MPEPTRIIRRAPCYVFAFGKHKGKTIWDVEEESPSYLRWAFLNIPRFRETIKADYPDILKTMLAAEQTMRHEDEAWLCTGGRRATFDDCYRRERGKHVPRKPAGMTLGEIPEDEYEEEDEDDWGRENIGF